MIEDFDELMPRVASEAQRTESDNDGPEGPKCPECGRILLSTSSKLCNWCGAVIHDAAYQKHAAEERAEFDAHEQRKLIVEEMKDQLIQQRMRSDLI